VGVGSPDFFDTLDDSNNSLAGLPAEIPAWTMIGATSYGSDSACGGIYSTGSNASGTTGADSTLSHDPNGNWQDLTPGVVPAATTTASSNPTNGCNASDKHCVFRDLISGLMVTESSPSGLLLNDAIQYCDKLGEASGAVAHPIPIIGGATYTDWRLPTQKELMTLYASGVLGLNETADLKTFFGDLANKFWSATVYSGDTSLAWWVRLSSGYTWYLDRSYYTYNAVCVR
jgi:hypothetical protein